MSSSLVGSRYTANKLAPTDRPDIGFAVIFPGMTIIKILMVDIAAAFF